MQFELSLHRSPITHPPLLLVCVNCNAKLQVLQFTRQEGTCMTVLTSQPQPFFVSHLSTGFKLMIDLLAATPAQLGFPPDPPDLPLKTMGGYDLSTAVLLRQGSGVRPCSHVFAVAASLAGGLGEAGTQMVLKLNSSDLEVSVHTHAWKPDCFHAA